jgi:hypothetical protein
LRVVVIRPVCLVMPGTAIDAKRLVDGTPSGFDAIVCPMR